MARRRRGYAASREYAARAPTREGGGHSFLIGLAGAGMGLVLYYAFTSVGVVNQGLREVTGNSAVFILRWLGWPAIREGTTITSGGSTLAVVTDYTPLAAFALITGAALAFPAAPVRAKLLCLLIGGMALFAVNAVRVASLLYLGDRLPDQLGYVHVLVWQGIMILLTLLIWLMWAEGHGVKQGR